mgnify:CR=1 FL=1
MTAEPPAVAADAATSPMLQPMKIGRSSCNASPSATTKRVTQSEVSG